MIRLTLLLTAGITGTMLIFGTEPKGATAAEAITVAVLDPAPEAKVVAEAPELPLLDMAKAQIIDLSAPAPAAAPVQAVNAQVPDKAETDGLIRIVAAPDAPADARQTAAVIASIAGDTVTVTGSAVNLRAGPSTTQAILGRLTRGQRAEVLGRPSPDWMQIRDIATGTVGYMSADFLAPVTPGAG